MGCRTGQLRKEANSKQNSYMTAFDHASHAIQLRSCNYYIHVNAYGGVWVGEVGFLLASVCYTHDFHIWCYSVHVNKSSQIHEVYMKVCALYNCSPYLKQQSCWPGKVPFVSCH